MIYFISNDMKKTLIHKKVRINRFSMPGHILQNLVKTIMIAIGQLDN